MIFRQMAAVLTILTLSSEPVLAGIIEGAPDVIVCQLRSAGDRPGGHIVFYVEGKLNDDITYYRSLSKQGIQLKVGADGVIDAKNIAGCDRKTLKEVREDGRAFDLR